MIILNYPLRLYCHLLKLGLHFNSIPISTPSPIPNLIAISYSTLTPSSSSLTICFNVRFINLVESLDQNTTWENVKIVRKHYLALANYTESSCTYLIPFEDIEKNIGLSVLQSNLTPTSSYSQRNLTKDVISSGTRMFLHLNSCPNKKTKEFFKVFFYQVFKKHIYEPTNSGIILYIMNVLKLFSNNGREIALKTLEEVKKLFQSQNQKSYNGKFGRFLSNSNVSNNPCLYWLTQVFCVTNIL